MGPCEYGVAIERNGVPAGWRRLVPVGGVVIVRQLFVGRDLDPELIEDFDHLGVWASDVETERVRSPQAVDHDVGHARGDFEAKVDQLLQQLYTRLGLCVVVAGELLAQQVDGGLRRLPPWAGDE